MLGCRPTSTSLGASIHMEQSLVGKVLSSWAIWPPMARRFFNQVNLKTRSGKIKRGLNTADPSTDNHDISKITVCETFTKLLQCLFNLFSISISSFSTFYHLIRFASVTLNHFLDNLRDVLNLVCLQLSFRVNLLSSNLVMQ